MNDVWKSTMTRSCASGGRRGEFGRMLGACLRAYLLIVPLLRSTTCFTSQSSRSFSNTAKNRSNLIMSASHTSTVPQLSTKIQATLDPCVVLMKELVSEYADAWKDRGGIFSLAQGVVYWQPPPSTKTALQAALDNDDLELHMYGPDEGLTELRTVLEHKIRDENGLTDHDVMITVGANQAYVNCVLTLMDSGQKAVVFKPYYFNHVMALQMTLEESAMLIGPSSDDGVPDWDWLEQQLIADPDIHMVTVVNPGNPTGTLLDRPTLQRAVDMCRQYQCWLVLDCTYEYFGDFDGCFADDHVVHIFSLSKSYALAGYRCGYLVAAKSSNMFGQLLKVQDTIPIAPSRISQIAALGALEAGRPWVKAKIATLDAGRRAILAAMAGMEQVMGGSGAMYVMGKLGDGIDDQALARALVRDYGVAVIPGSFCGFPGWIRVCYANLPPERCLEGELLSVPGAFRLVVLLVLFAQLRLVWEKDYEIS